MNRNVGGWFEFYVEDMERAKHFYQVVFSCELQPMQMPEGSEDMEMWAFPAPENMGDAPGAAGALVKMEGMSGGAGGTILYFSSHDCADQESRIESAGGQVLKPKEGIGEYGFMVLAQDTEGNVFGIHSNE